MNLVNQEVANVNKSLKKGINSTFTEMDKTVENLRHNIKFTDFKDKAQTAVPIAVISSVITLGGYALIRLIESLI